MQHKLTLDSCVYQIPRDNQRKHKLLTPLEESPQHHCQQQV